MAETGTVPSGFFYDVLGVDFAASAQEIRTAFKKKALKLHPDKGGTKEGFQLALKAFETLSDTRSRSRYDSRLNGVSGNAVKTSGVRKGKRSSTKPKSAPNPAEAEKQQPSQSQSEKCVGKAENHTNQRAQPENKPGRTEPQRAGFDEPSHTALNRGDKLLGLIYRRLCELSAPWRKTVLDLEFSQRQKLALESFLTMSRENPPPVRRRVRTESDLARRCRMEVRFSKSDSNRDSGNCKDKEQTAGIGDSGIHNLNNPRTHSEVVLDCQRRRSAEATCFPHDSDSDASNDISSEEVLMLFDQVMELDDNTAEIEDSCNGDPDEQSVASEGAEKMELHLLDSSDLPACDGDECGSHKRQRGPSSTGIKGISSKVEGNSIFYQAYVYIQCLRLGTRYATDLRKAVDHLVVLTSIKQQVLAVEDCVDFESKVRRAVQCVLEEQEITQHSIGLWYQVSKVELLTNSAPVFPTFPVFHNVDKALIAWRMLEPFRAKGRGGLAIREQWAKVVMFDSEWPKIKESLVDIFELAGYQRDRAAQKLDVYKDSVKPIQDRCIEKINRRAMALEERHQQKVSISEKQLELYSRRALLKEDSRIVERRVESWNRKSMSQEDFVVIEAWNRRAMRREDRHGRFDKNIEQKSHRVRIHVRRLLAKWELSDKCQRQKAFEAEKNRRRTEEAKRRREDARKADEKRKRWRWMNRPDITMQEILNLRGQF